MKFLYKIKNNLWRKVLPITVLGLTAASCTVTQTASRETDGIYYDPSTAVAEEVVTEPENNLVRVGRQYFNKQGEAPTVYTDQSSYSENVYTQDNGRYAEWGEEENDVSININNYGAFGGYYGMYSPYYYGSGFYFGIGSVYRPLGFYNPYYPSYPFGGYYGYNPYYGGYYPGFYNPYNPYYPYSPYNGYYGNGYYGGYYDYPNYYVPGKRVVRERGRGNTNNVPVGNRGNTSQVRGEQGQNNSVYIRDRRNRNAINQNNNPSVRSNSNEVRTVRERRVYPQERRREAPVRYNNNSDNTIRNRRSDNNINRRQSAPSINRGSINNGSVRPNSSNNVRRR